MNLPRHAELWFPSYALDRARHFAGRRKPKRLWVCIADHYEPLGGNVPIEVARARVAAWQRRWPEIALAAPPDSQGKLPCYTFFYPQEEYNAEIVSSLAELSRDNFADVEVHIHHNHDTPATFLEKIRSFCLRLHDDHGLLHHESGRLAFGFIHGNWALDNSRPDGLWCGLTGELQMLRDLGCYADFTMPSLPSPTQGRIVNKVYWSTGDAGRPRGFDHGIAATVGGGMPGDLLMVTGPLGLRYRERLLPRLETGEIAAYDPPTRYRVKRWLDLAPRVGDDIFLKLYAHGAREDNASTLLGTGNEPGGLAPMFAWIKERAGQLDLELHWVSAYGMFRAISDLIQPAAATVRAPRVLHR